MPARRPGGKAAKRKQRQRNVPRTPAAPRPTTPEPAAETTRAAAADAIAIPPVGTPDAREAASLDPPRRRTAPAGTTAGSGLSARDRADYHYVERDLRNLAVLTAAMAALLLVAWLVFNALGLVG